MTGIAKTNGSDLTSQLADYYASCSVRPLPGDVERKTLHHVIDTIAAIVSGAELKPGRLGRAFVRDQGGKGRAAVIGGSMRTSATMAAFANGMSAHADESDDSHAPSLLHPGCGIIPAALALAETHGRSGLELLRAVAAGYDAAVRFNFALGLQTLSRGVSNPASHLHGPIFGASVAAGVAAGFDADQFRYLFAYAGQQVAGTTIWLRDTEHVQKAFDFGGASARNGAWAATMVGLGYTGVPDALDGPKQNILDAIASPGRWPGDFPDREQLTASLGDRYEIVNANIKRYCVGSPVQAAVDGLSQLLVRRVLRPEDVSSIDVELPDDNYYVVDGRSMANINLQHLLALQIVDGELGFENVHDESRVQDARVLAIKQLVSLGPNKEYRGTRQARVTLRRHDGSEDSVHVEHVRGTAANPMSDDEVDDKARDLIGQVRDEQGVESLVSQLWELPTCEDVSSLDVLLGR